VTARAGLSSLEKTGKLRSEESPGSPRRSDTPRKVRTPMSRTVGNSHPEQSAGKCNREQTASSNVGKGETVV
jgi:hypothetical protein